MSRRFSEWQQAVFARGQDLVLASGFESILTNEQGTLADDAARAIRRLSEARGAHIAIESGLPLAELAWRCVAIPGAWLVAKNGRAVRDPRGRQISVRRRARDASPQVHGLREVVGRLPPRAAVLLGVDERVDLPAIAAMHVRPHGLALHVATGTGLEPAVADGVVHGRAAWVELISRLGFALDRRAEPRARTSQPWRDERVSA